MDTAVLIALVGAGSAVGGALIAGGVSAWVAHRQAKPQEKAARAAAVAAEASVQATINEGFAKLAAQYEARNADLLQQNAHLEGKLDEALGKLDQVTGEMRDLTQHVESLEAALRRVGHDIPQRTRPHPMAQPPLAIISGGETQTGGQSDGG